MMKYNAKCRKKQQHPEHFPLCSICGIFERMTQEETEKIIQQVVLRYIDPKEYYVFLFGSRAGAKEKSNSDYDIGLYGPTEISFGTIARIEGELEDYLIPQEIDFVDFSTVSAEFKEIALRKIKIWNTPKSDLQLK